MRLIDADALYEKTANWEAQALHMVEVTMYDEDKTEWRKWSTVLTERSAFKHDIADAPTIDAVEVVRCKDCCYWDRKTIRHNCNDFICWNEAVCEEHSIGGNEQHEMWTDADWFCADGERRDPCSSQDS